MNEKPEALRLADECDWSAKFKAAKELRRLHAENERLTANRDELDWMVQRLAVGEALLEAKNKRLREALEMIAGHRPCVIDGFKRGFMPGAEIAKAALRREETT